MNKIVAIILTLILSLLACVSTSSSVETVPTVNIETAVAGTQTAVQAQSTSTSSSTNTSVPANTIETIPTFSQTPTLIVPTVSESPIILTGVGDMVVDIQKWNGPALLQANYSGDGNFSIVNYGLGNEYIDLLVNTIGSYSGTVPLDFYDDEDTVRFEVSASGQWELRVLPFENIRKEDIPGILQGRGDDVVALLGNTPDLLIADCRGTSNFAVWGWTNSGSDLLVNEIAPYSGTVILDSDTWMLVINAESDWTIQISTQ